MSEYKGSVLNPWASGGSGGEKVIEGYLNNGVLYATKTGSVYSNPITLVEGKYYLDKIENSIYHAVQGTIESNTITFDGNFEALEYYGDGMYFLTGGIADNATANIVGATYVSSSGNTGVVSVDDEDDYKIVSAYDSEARAMDGTTFLVPNAAEDFPKGIYVYKFDGEVDEYFSSITSALGPLTVVNAITLRKVTDVSKANVTVIVTPASAASYALDANKIYKLGTLAGDTTFTLSSATAGFEAVYTFIFTTPATAPTITWPASISWAGGTAPTISASKTYEVNISEGYACAVEY